MKRMKGGGGVLYSSAGILALIIHLTINYDILWNRGDMSFFPARRSYRAFLIAAGIYYVSDILWGILYEHGLIALCFIDTSVYFTAMAFTILLWTRYVIAYLREDGSFGRLLGIIGWLLFGFQMLTIAVNFFVPVLFHFDESQAYHALAARYIVLAVQIGMFLTTAVYALAVTARSSGAKRLRHRTIGLFSIAMAGFISAQSVFPLLPLYAIGCMLSSCVLHTFVLENEREEYRDDLENRLRESVLKGNYYDLLTGLPGMSYFFELASKRRLALAADGDAPAFLYLNLSGLKFYNQRHGFAEGDRLLRAMSQLLTGVFGEENCSRLGQDHFAVLARQSTLEDGLNRLFAEWAAMNERDCHPSARASIWTPCRTWTSLRPTTRRRSPATPSASPTPRRFSISTTRCWPTRKSSNTSSLT